MAGALFFLHLLIEKLTPRHNAGGGGLYPNPYNKEYPQQQQPFQRRQSSQELPGVGLDTRDQLEPQFLIKGQKITAKLGDTVILPCKVANLGKERSKTEGLHA